MTSWRCRCATTWPRSWTAVGPPIGSDRLQRRGPAHSLVIMRLHLGRPAVVPTLLMAVTLVLAGCTSFSDTLEGDASSSAAASPTPEPKAAPMEWAACKKQIQPRIAGQPGSGRHLTFECSRTEVPISY